MTADELNEIKLKCRWPIRFSDFSQHYFFVIFPLFFIVLGPAVLYSGVVNGEDDLKAMGLAGIIGGTVLLIVIVRKLIQNQTFENYEIKNLSADKIRKALKPLKFANIYYYEVGYFVLTTYLSWFSWGEEVTLIFDDSEYLLIAGRGSQ